MNVLDYNNYKEIFLTEDAILENLQKDITEFIFVLEGSLNEADAVAQKKGLIKKILDGFHKLFRIKKKQGKDNEAQKYKEKAYKLERRLQRLLKDKNKKLKSDKQMRNINIVHTLKKSPPTNDKSSGLVNLLKSVNTKLKASAQNTKKSVGKISFHKKKKEHNPYSELFNY